MATTRTTNNRSARNGGVYTAMNGHTESATPGFGGQVDSDREAIERLNTELQHARNENRQLVDALRSLHGQFNSLQMHAEKQSALLLCGGEELQNAKHRLVSLERELERTRKEHERAHTRHVPENTKDVGEIEKSDAVLRARLKKLEIDPDGHQSDLSQSGGQLEDYCEALASMQQEIRDWKAVAEEQERDNAELALKMRTLERRCAELDGYRAERESAYEELQKTFSGRNKEIERLSRNVERIQKELSGILDRKAQEETDDRLPQNDCSEISDTVVTLPAIDSAYLNSADGEAVKPSWYTEENTDAAHWAVGAQREPNCSRKGKGIDRNPALRRYIIMPIGGKQPDSHYPLDKKVMTIGRSRSTDIPVVSDKVSRVHARIIQTGSRVIIEDMGSKNGLLVNTKPKRYQALKHGDTFTIGTRDFELFDSQAVGDARPTVPAA